MAQEECKFISLRDILEKENFPALKFNDHDDEDEAGSEEIENQPCFQTVQMPPPPLPAFASVDVPESSSRKQKIMNSSSTMERDKGKAILVANEDSVVSEGLEKSDKGKLFSAPAGFSLKGSTPLVYQILEGNGGVFVLDGIEISVNFSGGFLDNRKFKLAILCAEPEDQKELLHMKNKKEKDEKPGEEEEVAAGATNK